MAESQEAFQYDDENLASITTALSSTRLGKYFGAKADDLPYAIKMYLWNARLAKAFLFPLHIAEVTTRNSMHREFSRTYRPDWIAAPPFTLTGPSQQALEKAIERVGRETRKVRRAPTPNDYVAALTLDFWSNLFREDYDPVWSVPGRLRRVFPNLPENFGRYDVQIHIRAVNDLRNRVAHHEPIHKLLNLSKLHDDVIELVRWSCNNTSKWTRKHSTVETTLSQKPSDVSTLPGDSLLNQNLRPPVILEREEGLLGAMQKVASARPSLGLVSDSSVDPPYRVLFAKDFLDYLASRANNDAGMVDLGDHTVANLLGAVSSSLVRTISKSATTGDARALFFPSKTKETERPRVVLVVSDDKSSNPIGVIAHPEIRY